MIENGRVLTGCDTCEYKTFDSAHNCQSCSIRLDFIDEMEDGCPQYRMTNTYFCTNHAQYDKYTGLMKNYKWF